MNSCRDCSGCSPAGSPAEGLPILPNERFDYVVALAGNPNTGKSTVFNHLTGLRQHTGNWPGKTVARAEGAFVHGGKRFKLVDLPGTYSLLADSVDEEVARDFVLFGQPDCTVIVCDATVLERNLHLTLQILQITGRAVVCANLIDEAARKRIALETHVLEEELGVPVVPAAARRGRGIDLLVQRVHDVCAGRVVGTPPRIPFDDDLQNALDELAGRIESMFPGLPCAHWIAMRLLDGDQRIKDALLSGELQRVLTGDKSVAAAGEQL